MSRVVSFFYCNKFKVLTAFVSTSVRRVLYPKRYNPFRWSTTYSTFDDFQKSTATNVGNGGCEGICKTHDPIRCESKGLRSIRTKNEILGTLSRSHVDSVLTPNTPLALVKRIINGNCLVHLTFGTNKQAYHSSLSFSASNVVCMTKSWSTRSHVSEVIFASGNITSSLFRSIIVQARPWSIHINITSPQILRVQQWYQICFLYMSRSFTKSACRIVLGCYLYIHPFSHFLSRHQIDFFSRKL